MTCRICHATLHHARAHCHVCGTVVMGIVVIDSLTTMSVQKVQYHTVDNRLIAASHGADRTRQNPYKDKPFGKKYMIGD